MKFIPSTVEDEDKPVRTAEAAVLKRLKAAFRGNEPGVGYYRFPAVDRAGERFDREPDFILLHQDFGLTVVECKAYSIDFIDRIEGQVWYLNGSNYRTATPYSQAREQAFFIQSSYFMQEPSLRDDRGNCRIPLNYVVALPNITQEEWAGENFDQSPSVDVLLADDLTPSRFRDALETAPAAAPISQTEYENARAALVGGETISGERDVPDVQSALKGDLFRTVESGLKKLDEQQEEIGIEPPPGPQQIRGIAGSGKTVLLAMKAAAMHVKHPDWKIALTFNTRSLYDTIPPLVQRFVAHFSGAEYDAHKLDVLHGWGGSEEHGLYYKLAQRAGVEPHDVDSARKQFSNSTGDLFHEVCLDLLRNHPVQPEYDAILIDEGQDFEPGFYQLCHAALKEPHRLIWAYDEAQNLTSLAAPTPNEIFGTEEIEGLDIDVGKMYTGGVQGSYVMRKAYRTPRRVLMTAHALGMALKNPGVDVPRITRKDSWQDIGYEVEGDFRETETEIELRRPPGNSPHPLQDVPKARPFVAFSQFDSKDQEIAWVANEIATDIREEGLRPEQILVVCLGPQSTARSAGATLRDTLEAAAIECNLAWQGNASVFYRPDHVTISKVGRAKGNEAAQVYVLGLEEVTDSSFRPATVRKRNEAFVAITRSRAWCTITGTGTDVPIFDELDEILLELDADDPRITFPTPREHDGPNPFLDQSMPTRAAKLSEFTDDGGDRGASDLASPGTPSVDEQSRASGATSHDSHAEPSVVQCPVVDCGYENTLTSVSSHISGTSDDAHDWDALRDEWTDLKDAVGITQKADMIVTCPASECHYESELSSVAGHISGTSDEAHEWEHLGYSGALDFQERHPS